MKKILSVILAAILVLSLASSLSAFGAEVSPDWTLLERDADGANGSVSVSENGAFLLSAPGWTGYGIGSKKMYPLDANNPIEIDADITLGAVCPTGEGAEHHRFFAIILTDEALTYTKTYGASSLPGTENYVELRIYDTNAVDGSKMAKLNVGGVFTAFTGGKNSETVAISGFNATESTDAAISVRVNGNDMEFYFNGALLVTANGVAEAFEGKAYLNFAASAYGSAAVENCAVNTINGAPANNSCGTLEPSADSKAVLNEEKWTLCAPASEIGKLYPMSNGSFVLNSAGFGGIGVFSKEHIKIKNIEMTVDVSVPVGNIPTGGPDYIRGFSLVFAVNPIEKMEISGATAVPTDEGYLAIRITDDEAMDGKKNLYIIPSGSIANIVFGDVYGPVNEPIALEGIDVTENSSLKLTVKVSGKDLTVLVNGNTVATVEGIMKGFYGRASIGFTATSYGSALCQGVNVKLINGEAVNNVDFSKIQLPEAKTTGGCGNKG